MPLFLAKLYNVTRLCGKTEEQSAEADEPAKRSEAGSCQLPGATSEGFTIWAPYYAAECLYAFQIKSSKKPLS
jgi:hypothetical protein